MIILSHRGYWIAKEEQNTLIAFRRSFDYGFGIETDIRDFKGEIVVSHDPTSDKTLFLAELLELYRTYNIDFPLALNIKADGIQVRLAELLNEFSVSNYFAFDMSVPEGLRYSRDRIAVFTRQSEYEREPAFYDLASGIWLDEFHSHWINDKVIIKHMNKGKKVCIVSPELHHRTFDTEWNHYREIDHQLNNDELMICTDLPYEAGTFFSQRSSEND